MTLTTSPHPQGDAMTDRSTVLDHDTGQRWDDGDVRALRALRLRGNTIAECAAQLGRTVAGVRSKLYRLGQA